MSPFKMFSICMLIGLILTCPLYLQVQHDFDDSGDLKLYKQNNEGEVMSEGIEVGIKGGWEVPKDTNSLIRP